jgi:DNA-damage-inducible protein J
MTTLQIRIDEKTKKRAKETLESLGLDMSSGVKLFLEQVITTQSIPFSPVTPLGHKLRRGHIYQKEMKDLFKNGKRYKTVEEAFADIFDGK